MGRFLIISGVGLILISVAAMISMFAYEAIPPLEAFLTEQYCDPGETLTSAQRLATGGTYNSTTVFFCENVEGQRTEITGSIVLAIIIAFLVPFGLGMIFIFAGAARAARNISSTVVELTAARGGTPVVVDFNQRDIDLSDMNIPPEKMAQIQQVLGMVSTSFGEMAGNNNNTLAERLQQLEDAYQQGLITRGEYDDTRRAILDSMDDNV